MESQVVLATRDEKNIVKTYIINGYIKNNYDSPTRSQKDGVFIKIHEQLLNRETNYRKKSCLQ